MEQKSAKKANLILVSLSVCQCILLKVFSDTQKRFERGRTAKEEQKTPA